MKKTPNINRINTQPYLDYRNENLESIYNEKILDIIEKISMKSKTTILNQIISIKEESKATSPKQFKTFDDFFAQARSHIDYWIEGVKTEFTENVLAKMEQKNISNSDLARLLNVKPSHVTKLLKGNNNFTIDTMVKIAEVLNCHFRCHLEPADCKTHWIDISSKQITSKSTQFDKTSIKTDHGTLAAAA